MMPQILLDDDGDVKQGGIREDETCPLAIYDAFFFLFQFLFLFVFFGFLEGNSIVTSRAMSYHHLFQLGFPISH